MKKYGFYVSNNATRLKKLIQANFSNLISFVLIDNKLNKELEELCINKKIPLFQYDYEEMNLKNKERNKFISNKFLELLIEHKCEYGFIFGGKILEGKLLSIYADHLINFHPSLLPSYKGSKAIDQAITEGAIVSGNTAHFIDETLDGGKIIMQNIIALNNFKDYNCYLDNQIYMLIQIHNWINDNRLKIENNHVKIINATFVPSEYYPNLEIDKSSVRIL